MIEERTGAEWARLSRYRAGVPRVLYGDAGSYSEVRGSPRSTNSDPGETRSPGSPRSRRFASDPGRVFDASLTSARSATCSTKTCVNSSTRSWTSMSLAREIVAARCVTSSIAARTVTGPFSDNIRATAVEGATSPARHCTRIARISGGSMPSVRRLMASASRPVRLLMSARLEKDHKRHD